MSVCMCEYLCVYVCGCVGGCVCPDMVVGVNGCKWVGCVGG